MNSLIDDIFIEQMHNGFGNKETFMFTDYGT